MLHFLSLIPAISFLVLSTTVSSDYNDFITPSSLVLFIFFDQIIYEKIIEQEVDDHISRIIGAGILTDFTKDKRYPFKVFMNSLKQFSGKVFCYEPKLDIDGADRLYDYLARRNISIGRFTIRPEEITSSRRASISSDYQLVRPESPSPQIQFVGELDQRRFCVRMMLFLKFHQHSFFVSRWLMLPLLILICTTGNLVTDTTLLEYFNDSAEFVLLLVIYWKMNKNPTGKVTRGRDVYDEAKEIFVYGLTVYLNHDSDKKYLTIYTVSILMELATFSILFKSSMIARQEVMSILEIGFEESLEWKRMDLKYQVIRVTLLLVRLLEIGIVYATKRKGDVSGAGLIRHVVMIVLSLLI